MKIRFKDGMDGHAAGSIVEMDDLHAVELVRAGVATFEDAADYDRKKLKHLKDAPAKMAKLAAEAAKAAEDAKNQGLTK